MHFVLYRHPIKLDKMACGDLKVETNIPRDDLLDIYFLNNLSNIVTNVTLFQKTDNIALALSASI